MKKTYRILLIVGGVCAVVSFLILFFYCDYKKELFRDALIAVFTGCIFAIPSGISQAFVQRCETYEDRIEIAILITDVLNSFPNESDICAMDNSFKESGANQLSINVEKLDNLVRRLGNLANERCLDANDIVFKLLNELFELRKKSREFLKSKQFTLARWEEICRLQNDCLSYTDRIKRAS